MKCTLIADSTWPSSREYGERDARIEVDP